MKEFRHKDIGWMIQDKQVNDRTIIKNPDLSIYNQVSWLRRTRAKKKKKRRRRRTRALKKNWYVYMSDDSIDDFILSFLKNNVLLFWFRGLKL